MQHKSKEDRLACCTQSITRVLLTILHAAHEIWVAFSAQNIACMQHTKANLCVAHGVSHTSLTELAT